MGNATNAETELLHPSACSLCMGHVLHTLLWEGDSCPKAAGCLHRPVPHNHTQTSARSCTDSYLFTFRARVSFKARQTRWALWETGGKTKGRMRLWKTRSPISKPHQMRWSGRTIGPGGPSGPGDPGRPCSPCKTSQIPQSHRSWQQCSQLGLLRLIINPHPATVPGNICPVFLKTVKDKCVYTPLVLQSPLEKRLSSSRKCCPRTDPALG